MTESTTASASRWEGYLAKARQWAATPQARWLKRIVGAFFFLAINGYIVYTLIKDWDQIKSFDWLHLDLRLLSLTALAQLAGVCLAVYVWKFVMDRLGYLLPYRHHFRVYALSFLAQKLPGFGWSIISKVYLYGQNGADKVQVAVASSAEHVVAGISGALAALITLVFARQNDIYFQPWIPLAAVAVFFLIIVLPPFRRGLAQFSARRSNGRLRWPHFAYWVTVATIATLFGGLSLYFFCRALGVVDGSAAIPLIQGWALFVFAGALLFWLPVDVGINIAILLFILSQLTTNSQGVIVLIAWRIWNNVIVIAWALIGLAITRGPKPQLDVES